ncbi:MAG TPA: hypothetical protein VHB25_05175 [Gemmatimonadaceae bacterium]|nr:hypothetical protein [Gemmatimonadaceae bacterium]
MIRALVVGALLLAGGAAGARAQVPVHVIDPGPPLASRVIAAALSGPHEVVAPDSSPAMIARGSEHGRSVVVIGRDVAVDGHVAGDLTAIGGDVFMHPGGRVDGRVVAIGGGVYESTLARIGGASESFRDFTFDAAPAPDGGVDLRYRAVRVGAMPAENLVGVGFATPTYERADGLSLGVGPDLDLARWSSTAAARATYRSQLGAWDPSLSSTTMLGPGTALHVDVRRGTFSNDAWIWPDLANSIESVLLGDDARNYYRGTRQRISLDWTVDRATSVLRPYVALTHEHTGSVRPSYGAASGPWSLSGRHDPNDMLRPNFQVPAAHVYSAHAGLQLDWSAQGVVSHASLDEEAGRSSADCASCGAITRRFAQTTVDGYIAFPAFLTHTVRFDVHGVATSRGGTPAQRLVFLGGPGTLPTEPMLGRGGNELLFVDARYEIPIPQVTVPLLGTPSVALKSVLGGVALDRFPSLTQLAGVRLTAGYVYAEVLMEPSTRHAHGSVGLTFGR